MMRRVVLAARPTGVAQAEHFRIEPAPVQRLGTGQVRVRNRFLSVEPAMRGWIADIGNYSAPVGLGETMRALCVGEIVESDASGWGCGEIVCGWFGWQDEAVVDPDAIVRRVTETDLPASLALGVLGINGVTAYLALTVIGAPQPGETVVVSTAAGGVGSAVGQIAKIMGCRTIGITGSEAKRRLCLDRFGYDVALDYRAPGLAESVARACPDGVNVYYDNTAGTISDAVYPALAVRARVVVCGTAAIAAWQPWPHGPRIERHLLVKRARMEGFVVFDHMDRWDEAVTRLAAWIREGRLTYAEDVLDGLDACPDALAGIYRGDNLGKRIIRLSPTR